MNKEIFSGGDIEIYEEQDLIFIKAIDSAGLATDPSGKNVCPVELEPEEALALAESIIKMAKGIQKRER